MNEAGEGDLFGPIGDMDLLRWLIADLHDDLHGKLARFRQLTDLSSALGAGGTMMPGGEVVYNAWQEARTSFIHGNYIATVLVCQGMAENLLAAHLSLFLSDEPLPKRVSFQVTLERSIAKGTITEDDAADLRRLMTIRNPLSHHRSLDDPSNLSRRVLDTQQPAEEHLLSDASFAISMTVRLLALPAFGLSARTIFDETS